MCYLLWLWFCLIYSEAESGLKNKKKHLTFYFIHDWYIWWGERPVKQCASESKTEQGFIKQGKGCILFILSL